MRILLASFVATTAIACGAPGAPDAALTDVGIDVASADALDEPHDLDAQPNRDAVASDTAPWVDAISPNCTVPPGADPHVAIAVPRPGLRCVRYPFPLAAPRDVIEARDGSIFVTEQAGGRIQRLTARGFVPIARVPSTAVGIRETADGSLLVADEGAQGLFRVDRATGMATQIAHDPNGGWTYLALGADGAAYLSSFTGINDATGSVRRVAPDGGVSDFATGLAVPEALSFEPGGALVLAEWGIATSATSARVLRLPATGGAASSAQVLQSGLLHVYGLTAATSGGWFVAVITDVNAGYVEWLRPDGTVTTILTNVAAPTGMTVTASGDLLITEHVDINSHGATGYLIRLSGF